MEENTIKEFEGKYKFEEAEEEFNKIGINYTIRSVVYLKSKKKTFNDFLDYDDYNTILFVACGLNVDGDKEEKALDIIQGWLDKGYTLKMLWSLCYRQAEEVNGFFTTEDEVDFLMQTAEKIQSQIGKAVMYLTATGKTN